MTWEEAQKKSQEAAAAGDHEKAAKILSDYALAANNKIEGLNGEAAKYRKTASERADLLSQFDGIDPANVREMQTKLAQYEQNKLKNEGKFDEALAEATKGFQKEIESLQNMIKGKDDMLSKVTIDNAFLSAIDGKAVNNEHVLALVRGNIKLENGVPVVYEGDSPKLNGKGERMSISEYGLDFLSKNPHLAKATPGGSGSQNGGSVNGDGKTVIDSSQIGDNIEAVAKGEVVVNTQ